MNKTKRQTHAATRTSPRRDQIRNTALRYALDHRSVLRLNSQNEVVQCAINFEKFLLGRYSSK
jgi:hypothetical protein